MHFLVEDADRTDHLPVAQQRNRKDGARAGQVGIGAAHGIALHIGAVGFRIQNVNSLLGPEQAPHGGIRAGANKRLALAQFGKRFRRVMQRDAPRGVALHQQHHAELGFTNPGRVRQHVVEDRLQVAG